MKLVRRIIDHKIHSVVTFLIHYRTLAIPEGLPPLISSPLDTDVVKHDIKLIKSNISSSSKNTIHVN